MIKPVHQTRLPESSQESKHSLKSWATLIRSCAIQTGMQCYEHHVHSFTANLTKTRMKALTKYFLIVVFTLLLNRVHVFAIFIGKKKKS